MKLKLSCCSFLMVFVLTSKAQTFASDSKGKDVFNFYKSASLSIPISVATATAKINLTEKIGSGKQYYVNKFKDENGKRITLKTKLNGYDVTKKEYPKADSLRFTMAKSTGINISFALGNLLTNFAKVSTFHPNYTFSTGFGKNIDAFNNWENIKTLSRFFTYNINGYLTLNNIEIYDTLVKKSDRKRPLSKGIILEGTSYFPRIFMAKKHQNPWLLALSASINYENGNNIALLKNYQANTPTYSNIDIIALGDIVGKFGDLQDQNSFRARLSVPIFPTAMMLFRNKKAETDGTKKYKDSLQFCLIPYWTFFGPVNTHLSHIIGVYLNISQGQNLFAKNSTIVPGLGIGIDWSAASNGISNANIFVAGSIDIHSLFDHKKAALQGTK